MHIIPKPNTIQKITQMGDLTLFEAAGDDPMQEKSSRSRRSEHLSNCIAHLQTPKGPKPVLKSMLTTACERNCFYCPFRAGHSQTRRMTISPDEMASAFDTMQRSKQVDGLFLSSGIIKGGITTQDKLIDTVEIIRKKYQYPGYIHMKIMPGTEYDQIKRAMQISDRISINLEAPTSQRLQDLAPKKHFAEELLAGLQQAHKIRQENPQIRASIVTQFVVGAVGDTDLEILSLSERLYHQLGLARAYYSPFTPLPGTPFEGLTATPDIRERRLYQASFLLRDYAWDIEELPFIDEGNLRTDIDPKLAYAQTHLLQNPVDIMKAEKHQLLRLPGIGPKSVETILKARKQRILRDFGQLARLGIRQPEQLAPYVLLDGEKPLRQLSLF